MKEIILINHDIALFVYRSLCESLSISRPVTYQNVKDIKKHAASWEVVANVLEFITCQKVDTGRIKAQFCRMEQKAKRLGGERRKAYFATEFSTRESSGEENTIPVVKKQKLAIDETLQLKEQLEDAHRKLEMSKKNQKQKQRTIDKLRRDMRNIQRKLVRKTKKTNKANAGEGIKMEQLKASIDNAAAKIKCIEEKLAISQTELNMFQTKSEALTAENKKLKNENRDLEISLAYTETLLNDDVVHFYDDTSNKYTAKAVECVCNLTNLMVSNKNIGPVITEVLKVAGRTANRLPHPTTVDIMARDIKAGLSHIQLGEVLDDKTNTTLHMDETRKNDNVFNTYMVTDDEQTTYLLGLREMPDKSADTMFETFNEVLDDIESASDIVGKGKQIIKEIKNMMGDRAQVNTSFLSKLENYRRDILPSIVEGWDDLSQKEKEGIAHINSFFCGLHLLVNMAEIAAEVFFSFEKVYKADENWSGSESQAIELSRVCSKCFGRGVNKRNGCYI